ncbi:hypothetical protein PPACK8108_LOCUS19659 [Phakopsora pachyrhizi]|uniref:HECT domain-containing protein n=1 Tax=Phakopsora pachyrhizi TaxID=170000 RepID=A0AAV0BFK1_PHAPC|nr:hypothetical protein PPACK8108_LOCUS19659 [Phakopsora pachyrhizi]
MPRKNRPAKSISVSHSSPMASTSNPAPVLASLDAAEDRSGTPAPDHDHNEGSQARHDDSASASELDDQDPAEHDEAHDEYGDVMDHDHPSLNEEDDDDDVDEHEMAALRASEALFGFDPTGAFPTNSGLADLQQLLSSGTLGSLDSMGFSGFCGLGGIMAGFTHRLKNILNSLKALALQELAEILAVSNEDTLAGYFQTDSFARELVSILRGTPERNELEDEDEDEVALVLHLPMVMQMLLASRCLANLMEALPGSAHTVVHHGLTALLQYLDFFSTNQAVLAITRVTDSYRHHPDKLQQLLTPEVLSSLTALLSPIGGTKIRDKIFSATNIGQSSPEVATNLIDAGLADTFYGILIGQMPPDISDEYALADDLTRYSSLITQALMQKDKMYMMWRNHDKCLRKFKVLGQFMAKALMDSRIVDLSLSRCFAQLILDYKLPLTIASVRLHLSKYFVMKQAIEVFGGLTESERDGAIRQIRVDGAKVEDLAVELALPGYDIEMKPDGTETVVAIDNVKMFKPGLSMLGYENVTTNYAKEFNDHQEPIDETEQQINGFMKSDIIHIKNIPKNLTRNEIEEKISSFNHFNKH